MAVNGNGEGHMTDANSFGARLDYAVAANLNAYGAFFYARRVSGSEIQHPTRRAGTSENSFHKGYQGIL